MLMSFCYIHDISRAYITGMAGIKRPPDFSGGFGKMDSENSSYFFGLQTGFGSSEKLI